MKITVIYGNNRRGSTYHSTEIIKKAMLECGEVAFEEVWLPKDLPEACLGCFNCILKGEGHCPHNQYVSKILDKIISSDGIILASPVYGLDVSGAMKTFIDHLCFMWMPHRPHGEMFSKIGFVVSTAAGGGTRRTNQTMMKALNYMGLRRIYSYGRAVAASSWEDVADGKRLLIKKELSKKARRFYFDLLKRRSLRVRTFTRILFMMMKGMISRYKDDNLDKEYWRAMGWLKDSKPF
ncbi:flavodoxin family protein [Alkaliphilus serpentinus]|uniref:NAD(P)H-dependent oxidoreductase n=1 Tax=Alkaliphilus serpentinus TaxID=1482731 RepID=A0A833HMV4_9FIRM|nr:NAD(P)H-dependent oxidoreductase [Alkaliphilus serpentinus]KAB3528961.1 NAD(P)H-dependent oxidoreductase [Alkaliphilus serpentinus]